jgi:lysophospholipase L1-like esterase
MIMIYAALLAAMLVSALSATVARAADSSSVHREDIEWCDIWITDGTGTTLPRVLLIGDSITRYYYPPVADRLKGKASVSRLSTSKSVGDPVLLAELAIVLKEYHWDVIHFNNGMHGWDYTEEDYKKAYSSFIATIKKYAPNAKLICATTTPVYAGQSLNPRTDRVIERNKIATTEASKRGIAIDDIFSLMNGHPEYYSPDGVHPNDSGIAVEAADVAQSLLPLLAK